MTTIYASDELEYVYTHFGVDAPSIQTLKRFFTRFYNHYNNKDPDIVKWIPDLMHEFGMSRFTVERIIELQVDFLISKDVLIQVSETTGKTRSTTFKQGTVLQHTWNNDYHLYDL